MPKVSDKKDKKVTIYVVHSTEDEIIHEDDEEEEEDDDDDDDDYDDDEVLVKKEYKTRGKKKELESKPKKEKIPISKRFNINKGNPITDLKSLINAFDNPKASTEQKELIIELKNLDSMIGMISFKEQIINQILFFLQDMQDSQTFLHTVITGPPGTGKTQVINILAKIYCKLGILESDKVVKADRSSLIGGWLGTTAIKTKEVLESANGGILILDEVYSLGNTEHTDTFSKECIDTINQYLSEHVGDFICVVAGYHDLVQKCFFDANPGLDRRFPWRFSIESYTHDELLKILKNQLEVCGYKLDNSIGDKYIIDLIRNNKDCFGGNGGDTKNLIDKCRISNARRIFTQNVDTSAKKKRKKHIPITEVKKILTKEDIDNGFKSFLDSKKEKQNLIHLGMYS
jgi:SpoVK/Ycf46/Vps4 family AAA+-type ATPase